MLIEILDLAGSALDLLETPGPRASRQTPAAGTMVGADGHYGSRYRLSDLSSLNITRMMKSEISVLRGRKWCRLLGEVQFRISWQHLD